MRIPFFSPLTELPFAHLLKHAEKVKECGWLFQQAIECFFSNRCDRFIDYMGEIGRMESEADAIKYRIKMLISKKGKMSVDKYQLFMYIREQDKVIDCVEECLNWISYRPKTSVPEDLKKSFFDLVDAVVSPIEELSVMVSEAKIYFDNYSDSQARIVKNIILNLHKNEHVADKLEDSLMFDIFTKESNPIVVFHLIELARRIGAIADHAENTGDMMRAMIEGD